MNNLDQELRELRQSAPPPERLDAVRARVLARIAAQEQIRWGGWFVGATTAVLLTLSLWKFEAPPTETLEFAWIPPAAPESAFRIRPRHKPQPRPVPRAAATPQEIRVVAWTEPTLEQPGSTLLALPSTDDNVVLYFVLDPQGD